MTERVNKLVLQLNVMNRQCVVSVAEEEGCRRHLPQQTDICRYIYMLFNVLQLSS